MAAKAPKLANIIGEAEVGQWLAEAIQDKVAKENAGFVQVELQPRTSEHPTQLFVKNGSRVVHTLEVTSKRQS